MPSMRPDEDSVSTFHPGATINLADETDEEGVVPTITHATPSLTRILKTSRSTENDTIPRISMSDSASRISSLEPEFSAMSKDFRDERAKLKNEALVQSKSQLLHGSMLIEILTTLKQFNLSMEPQVTLPKTPEAANHPQVSTAGDSPGVAGQGKQ